MSESKKIKSLNNSNYLSKYLKGKVIDIGAGKDPILNNADIFDIEHGDANHILDYVKKKYDTVYSSNLIEHLNDPIKSVKDFETLVKDNGYLILIIPTFEYYEQSIWPSIFNIDHKFAFTYYYNTGTKNYLLSINNIIECLSYSKLIKIESILENYNKSLIIRNYMGLKSKTLRKISRISFEINKMQIPKKIKLYIFYILKLLNIPVDQSAGESICSTVLIFHKCLK